MSCKKWGKRPYQFTSPFLYSTLGDSSNESSEDCLNLNIWAHENVEEAPVLVWFYGGFNHMGETSLSQFYLDKFAEQGIIGVTLNYRVGPLGFYDFSRLDDSFDSNCAVSDMIAGINWVKDNISAFGGDPNNITIGGESAGGSCVYSLLAAPSAKGTFQKAIAMSGLASNITNYRTHELNNKIFLDAIGIDPANISQLRKMPVECMVPGGVEVYENSSKNYHPGIIVTGAILDDLIPKYPWEALEEGSADGVACIFGTTKDEGSIFYMSAKAAPTNWEEAEMMFAVSGCLDKFEEVKALYSDLDEARALMEFSTDRLFWSDSIKCSLAQCKHNNVYSYRYDYATPENIEMGIGASHASDVPGALNTKIRETDVVIHEGQKQVYNELHKAFVQFIKTGNPNGVLPINWECYDKQKQATYVFNETSNIEYNPKQKNFDIWKNIQLYH